MSIKGKEESLNWKKFSFTLATKSGFSLDVTCNSETKKTALEYIKSQLLEIVDDINKEI